MFLDMVKNIVGKEENAGHQHFLLFPTMFLKDLFLRVVKTWELWVQGPVFTRLN